MTRDIDTTCPDHPQCVVYWRTIVGYPGEHACCAICKRPFDSYIRGELDRRAPEPVVIRSSADEVRKDDAEKQRFDLIPFKALGVTVDVLTFGAGLYGAENWRKVPNARARYFAAALRHLTAWWLGERNDAKSSKPHLGHALCCVMFLLELEEEEQK